MILKPVEKCGGCPLFEAPYGKKVGFSVPTGEMTGGVAIVAEALGADEEIEGIALVGKSGYALFQQLARVGIQREQFRLLNVLSCRPPDNKLVKMPYEKAAISCCSPILDANLAEAREMALGMGKTFVIVTLGVTSFKRILNLDYKKDEALLKSDFWGYPFWSDQYRAWVFAAPHPAYLLRGKANLWPIVQFVFNRAIEVANGGLTLLEHDYLLDPQPHSFDEWIRGYEGSLGSIPDNPLSYDIETPYKKKTSEEDLGKEDDADHTILRVSFSYLGTNGQTSTVSVKWSTEFLAGIERLFEVAPYVLGWNSDNYDSPRVQKHVPIKGVGIDGMVAWHVLNTSLPKSLGFVTPYYVQNTTAWKYLSEAQPAFYNAKDAEMALLNYVGIKKDLQTNRLWDVFDRHVLKLNKALKYMSNTGILRDETMRQGAEDTLGVQLDAIAAEMETAVPQEARKFKIYKKKPKVVDPDMFEVVKEFPVKYCSLCSVQKPTKLHTKICPGFEVVELVEPQVTWAKPLEFKISKVGLTKYQQVLKHQAIVDWREQKTTFNEDAMTRLMKAYPSDRLYPLIGKHRKIQKLLSTYIGVTQFKKISVPDDYILQVGEKWVDENNS